MARSSLSPRPLSELAATVILALAGALSCVLSSPPSSSAQSVAPGCGLEEGVFGDPTLRCQLYAPDPLVSALVGEEAHVPPRLNFQARVAQAGILLGDRVLPRVLVKIYDLKDQLVCAGERANVVVSHSVLDYTLDEADLGGCDLAELIATRRELKVVLCVGELSCLRPLKLSAVPYALKSELAYWARSAHQVERSSVAHYAQRLTADRDLLLSTRAGLPQNLTGSLVAHHAQLASAPHPATGEVFSVPAAHVGSAGLIGWSPARPSLPATLHISSKDPNRDVLRRLARLSVVAERLVVADELRVEGLPRAAGAPGRDGLELLGGDLYLKNPLSVGGGLLVQGDALAPPADVSEDLAVTPVLDARRYALSVGDVNADVLSAASSDIPALRLDAGDLLLDGQLAVGRDLQVQGAAEVLGDSSVAGRLSAGSLTVVTGGAAIEVDVPAGAALDAGGAAARLSSLSVLPHPSLSGVARALRVSRGDLVVEGAAAGGEGLSVTGSSDLGALSTGGFATSALAMRLREQGAAGVAEVTLSALRAEGVSLSVGDPSAKLVVHGETRLEGEVVFEGPAPTSGGGCRLEVPPDQEGRPLGSVERLSLVCGEQVVTVRPFRCGNRRVDPGEQCDHGNLDDGDGCSSHCLCEPENLIDGVYFRPAPGETGLVPCSGNLCGNEVVDVGEECDDGTPEVNTSDLNDTCELCKVRACGNGVLGLDEAGAPEECDDGNLIDGDGCSRSCTSENDPPVASPDAVTVVEDSAAVSISVLTNDTDPDLFNTPPDILSLVSCAPAQHGVATVDRPAGVVRYTPSLNYVGADVFSCRIQDRAGSESSADVTVTVTNVNDPPVAVVDALSVAEGGSATVNVLTNDTDPDLANPVADRDTLSVVSCTNPARGDLSVNNATGAVTYTVKAANPNFVGADSFSCTIRDTSNVQSTAAVAVTVTNVNDPPVAVADSLTVVEGGSATVNVLTNDTDPDLANPVADRDTLSVVSCTNPARGDLSVNNATGAVTYTVKAANPNFVGADSFSCTIRDTSNAQSTAAVTVTVTNVNDPPVAVADTLTITQDTPGTVDVLANDLDPDLANPAPSTDRLSVVSCSGNPSNATITVNALTNIVTYTPKPRRSGPDTFTCTIRDLAGDTSSASVAVSVADVNDAPVAVADTLSVVEGGSNTVNVLTNDTDPDLANTPPDTLSVVSCSNPTRGDLSVNNATGEVTYTVNAANIDFVGADSFDCTIRDAAGLQSAAAVTVTVTNVNDAPVAVADTLTVVEGSSATVNVLSNDTDPDLTNPVADRDTLTVLSCTNPTRGDLSVNNATGAVTYTVNAANIDFVGADSFDCTIQDAAGLQSTAAVTVTVTNVNDAPVAVADTLTVTGTTPGAVSVLVNDTDPDLANPAPDTDALTLVSCTDPTSGVLSSLNTPAGSVTYTANAANVGSDTFSCTIQDSAGLQSSASVTVTVNP